jgi:ATP-dependent Clp protease ATP-binding subunit ClpC
MDDALIGLGDDARRAVERADADARELGQEHVGTEHLLIGLLEVDPAIASALSRAGGTVAAARHKVRETAGDARPSSRPSTGPLPMTSRATRAIGRAVRFSHHDRSEVVGTRHLLMGVLDVEGTAGQVLRGSGVDVAALVAGLEVAATPITAPRSPASVTTSAATSALCPSCAAPVDDALGFRVISARGAGGELLDAVVFTCGACGAVVGASRA